jgi:Ca2+-binding EF-hand superfamily protein
MKHKKTLAIGLLVVAGLAAPFVVSAQGMGNSQMPQVRMGEEFSADHRGQSMTGGQAEVMQNMMRMHRQKMHGQMRGGIDMPGMMSPKRMAGFDKDGDGKLTAKEAAAGLEQQLKEYDADSDGTLSIAEYEKLHSAMIREKMVDRFQHLDADGDGVVTRGEMTASSKEMARRYKMIFGTDKPGAGKGPSGQNMGDGPMTREN